MAPHDFKLFNDKESDDDPLLMIGNPSETDIYVDSDGIVKCVSVYDDIIPESMDPIGFVPSLCHGNEDEPMYGMNEIGLTEFPYSSADEALEEIRIHKDFFENDFDEIPLSQNPFVFQTMEEQFEAVFGEKPSKYSNIRISDFENLKSYGKEKILHELYKLELIFKALKNADEDYYIFHEGV